MNLCEMKSSGVDWVGDIPITWDVQRISSFYTLRSQKVSDKDYPPLSVTKKGILPQLDNIAKTNNGNDRKLVRKGDFVINSRSDRRGSCGISPYDGSVSCINTVLCPFGMNEPRYLNWLFHTERFADEFYKWGKGIVDDLWSTGWQEMKRISIPVPPISEQIVIANFLDSKCEEIDALKADIEKQIETLQEYKKSVITEAVTKGLDPNVEMKNSGVEWIGLIPKHWGTLSLQYLLSFSGSGTTPKGLDKLVCEDGNGINWLNTGDLTDSYIESIPQKLKAEVMQQYSSLRLYPSGSLVIAMYGATAGKLGILLEPSMTNQACCVLVPNKDLLNLKYLFYQLLAARSYLVSLAKGGGQPNISQETVRKFKVCFTELQEQSNIVNFLDEKCNIIDGAIEIKKRQLETLAQYKQSIIYEYVTGKKAVSANF